MPKSFWLAKSEPSTYPWSQLLTDKRTAWEGVRSFEARNNLRAMKKGDFVLFYHSNEGKDVVGIAKVVKEAYPDPTAEEGEWSVVDLAPHKALSKPVSLTAIKADKRLASMALVKKSRLSVSPVTEAEFERLLALGGTKV